MLPEFQHHLSFAWHLCSDYCTYVVPVIEFIPFYAPDNGSKNVRLEVDGLRVSSNPIEGSVLRTVAKDIKHVLECVELDPEFKFKFTIARNLIKSIECPVVCTL
jgi:hypothetical protein